MFRGPESGEVIERRGQRIRQNSADGVGFAEIQIIGDLSQHRPETFESYEGDLDIFCIDGYCKIEMRKGEEQSAALIRPNSLQHIPKGTEYRLVPAKIADEAEQLACTILEVSRPPRVK